MTYKEDIENSRVSKLKSHLARRWWIYALAIGLTIFLIIVLAVIFVVIPSMAQNSVNGATVQIDGIAITNPRQDNITISMNSTVKAQVPVGGTRLSPQTFEMYLPGADNSTALNQSLPFATLSVGELGVKDTFSINVAGSDTKILNQEMYQRFSTQVLKNDVINLGIVSNPPPRINIGPLSYSVNFQKIVQLKGFNMLKGITLTNASVLTEPLEDGTNMLADGIIPNPSSFIMQVGDLTSNITLSGLELGFSVIKDLVLFPGDNKVTVRTHLKEGFEGSPLVTSVVTQPNINITLTIASIVFNGEHITWLEKPMADLSPFFAILNPQPVALEDGTTATPVDSSTDAPIFPIVDATDTPASTGLSADKSSATSTATATATPTDASTDTSASSTPLPTESPITTSVETPTESPTSETPSPDASTPTSDIPSTKPTATPQNLASPIQPFPIASSDMILVQLPDLSTIQLPVVSFPAGVSIFGKRSLAMASAKWKRNREG